MKTKIKTWRIFDKHFVNNSFRTARCSVLMNKKSERNDKMLDRIALILLIIGGINWGLIGIFQFDLVAWAFGGSASIISRIVYVLVAISAVWCVSLFFRNNRLVEND